jgi:hypothetical protein
MRRTAVVVLLGTAGTMLASTPALAGKRPAADTTRPTVAISTPGNGSSVSSSLAVSGTASDNKSLSRVDVQVDGGSWNAATGTTSWSATVSGLAAGSHTVTARATDASGNTSTSAVSVSVASSSDSTTKTSGSDIVLADPAASYQLQLLGRGKAASFGTLSGVLYGETFTSRRAMFFRDSSTGASSYVPLSTSATTDWADAVAALTSSTDLWVLGGGGPVYLQHYMLSGGTVPTSATLVSSRVLGDSDSRTGDLMRLRSGGLVVVWHQQEATSTRALYVAYVSPAGAWQALPALTFMPTSSSKQTLVQHPADDTVWLFSDPDAWAATGAVHLTESSSGLTVDWTNGTYLSKTGLGDVGPEGENPDLAATPDPAAGTIDLAYENATTKLFSTSPFAKGAYVTIARIPASGAPSFLVFPTYVERISGLALSVVGSSLWLSYRPVDPGTLTSDKLYSVKATGGSWTTPLLQGQLASSSQPLTYTPSSPMVAARMADGNVHVFTLA